MVDFCLNLFLAKLCLSEGRTCWFKSVYCIYYRHHIKDFIFFCFFLVSNRPLLFFLKPFLKNSTNIARFWTVNKVGRILIIGQYPVWGISKTIVSLIFDPLIVLCNVWISIPPKNYVNYCRFYMRPIQYRLIPAITLCPMWKLKQILKLSSI